MRLALKIDVDTLVGFKEGVPALLALLAQKGIKTSFFVAMGPDHSGRAIRRLFTHKGFLQKMLRTGAPRLYGFKTMCYGTILPGPPIAASAPELLHKITAAGHELGLHGYDHVRWQDSLSRLSTPAVLKEIIQAQKVFVEIMGYPAVSFAAPGWQCTAAALDVLVQEKFYYCSNTRGYGPYLPCTPDRTWPLLEIPTTLPTMDELLGLNGRTGADFNREILASLKSGQTQVLTIHAEVEGRLYAAEFSSLLDQIQDKGVKFIRLLDYAQELWRYPELLEKAEVAPGRLPGRAGTVSCQHSKRGTV
ncbi:polysaccharide deacetylase family protein [Desulfobacca acetoxidans]|uniref:Polysaccharide deacetylase n=1 Tax=Desulfobacca acetoxidans (strain ATCC 700848 / DSM 11109 / ASRB2) TaxID=880072 RepID=F2NIU0_DESAR|nr:polysaccharide deacetylase family protein [Desulfobacca acetoxidans]AEB10634.1 polysaccharide deacetylase [Desulfobacca acetoxidans DSM 11109]